MPIYKHRFLALITTKRPARAIVGQRQLLPMFWRLKSAKMTEKYIYSMFYDYAYYVTHIRGERYLAKAVRRNVVP